MQPVLAGMCFPPAPAQAVLALQDARLDTGITSALAVSMGEEPLLAWAQDAYGGITSYSELRDPRWVQLRLGEGAWGWLRGSGVFLLPRS